MKAVESRTCQIGVLGLGYVGLPLAMTFAESGFRVLGFDIDPQKVEYLERGECYIEHLGSSRLRFVAEEGRFRATTDFSRLDEPDALLICVPTPLTRHREPEMKYVIATAQAIGHRLRSGQLVVLESTTYPGTTDELLKDLLEQESGLKCGQDFFLAYSPEREDPGNPDFRTSTIPKVLGGVNEVSATLTQALYGAIVVRTVRVSSARVAEATKLMENIFRAVNIALVNELKMVYDRLGIDIWEVLDAAETKPFGFMRFNPGPGWGGHCIPLDPFYLSWKAREFGIQPKFIELAGEINIAMPRWVLGKLQEALNQVGKPVKGAEILILGLAYKKDISDPRESPAFEIIDLLLKLGAKVSYHDPHVPTTPKMRSWPNLPPMKSVEPTPELLQNLDAVLLVTDHTAVNYDRIASYASLIVDTRGIDWPDSNAVIVRA